MTDGPDKAGTITILLQRAQAGEIEVMNEVMRLIYEPLKCAARKIVARARPDVGMDATGLVNEAYGRLIEKGIPAVENRGHFVFLLKRKMDDVFVERARADLALKRGGGQKLQPLTDVPVAADQSSLQIDILDAIEELRKKDVFAARVIELHFYCDCTFQELADMLQCAPSAVRKAWGFARVWLRRRLSHHADDSGTQ